MDARSFLLGALAGCTGGTLAGLFGVGGGIVLVPLLALFLGVDQHQAQGLTLVVLLLPNALPAVVHYRRQGHRLHWGLAFWLCLGFVAAVAPGAAGAGLLPGRVLRLGFAAVLLLLAWRSAQDRPGNPGGGEPPARVWAVALGVGALGGLASGALGIGGGVVMIPLLSAWLRLSQHEAQLTSMLVMLPPVGLPGVLVYARQAGAFPWILGAGLALGFQGGAALGARLATRLSTNRLRRAFAVLLVLMAVLLALKAA